MDSSLQDVLSALVPPPRLNLVRYHGVLAPNASELRLRVTRPQWAGSLPSSVSYNEDDEPHVDSGARVDILYVRIAR